MTTIAVLMLGACGRIGYDPVGDATRDDAFDPATPFGPPTPVAELGSMYSDQDPCLTADGLEIVFASRRLGTTTSDIFTAVRSDPTAPFDPPTLVIELQTPDTDGAPKISGDGLALWFTRPGSTGGLDIWVTTRVSRDQPWSAPVEVPELSSPMLDVPSATSPDRSTIAFYSDRTGTEDLYIATRSDPSAAWQSPIPIAELNTLDDDSDASLTSAWTDIYFASTRDSGTGGGEDLWRARRSSVTQTFTDASPLVEINSTASDGDPYISPDGRTLYFASNRGGNRQIYRATR